MARYLGPKLKLSRREGTDLFIEMGEKKQHQGYCTDLIGDLSLDWLQRRPVAAN